MMSIEELVEMKYQLEQDAWNNYQQAIAENPALVNLLQAPVKPRSREQIRSAIESRALAGRNFRIPGASYRSFKRRN